MTWSSTSPKFPLAIWSDTYVLEMTYSCPLLWVKKCLIQSNPHYDSHLHCLTSRMYRGSLGYQHQEVFFGWNWVRTIMIEIHFGFRWNILISTISTTNSIKNVVQKPRITITWHFIFSVEDIARTKHTHGITVTWTLSQLQVLCYVSSTSRNNGYHNFPPPPILEKHI